MGGDNPMLRLAIVGLKGHQKVVLAGAKKLGDVKVVAVSDDDSAAIAKARKDEELLEGADEYRDWRRLLDHAAIDMCCVCDENYLRDEQLVALAERNIHIVTEKPLATSLEKLERVRRALAQSKSRMTMLLTMRHDPLYVRYRELIQGGAVGNVVLATAQKSYQLHTRPEWFKHQDRLGGIIPYIGIHAVDLIRWTTGLEMTHVAGFQGRIGKPEMKETENHASLVFRLSNGGSATVRLDYLRPMQAGSHGDDRLRVAGDLGTLEIGAPGDAKILHLTGDKPPQRIVPTPTSNLFVDFVESLRSGRPSRIPAEDCFTATTIVLTARAAAAQQTMLALPPPERSIGR